MDRISTQTPVDLNPAFECIVYNNNKYMHNVQTQDTVSSVVNRWYVQSCIFIQVQQMVVKCWHWHTSSHMCQRCMDKWINCAKLFSMHRNSIYGKILSGKTCVPLRLFSRWRMHNICNLQNGNTKKCTISVRGQYINLSFVLYASLSDWWREWAYVVLDKSD